MRRIRDRTYQNNLLVGRDQDAKQPRFPPEQTGTWGDGLCLRFSEAKQAAGTNQFIRNTQCAGAEARLILEALRHE